MTTPAPQPDRRIALAVAALAASFPRRMDADNLMAYTTALADCDPEMLGRAVEGLRRSAQWLPTIREVLDAVDDEKARRRDLTARQQVETGDKSDAGRATAARNAAREMATRVPLGAYKRPSRSSGERDKGAFVYVPPPVEERPRWVEAALVRIGQVYDCARADPQLRLELEGVLARRLNAWDAATEQIA
jgi:hypothetical protein